MVADATAAEEEAIKIYKALMAAKEKEQAEEESDEMKIDHNKPYRYEKCTEMLRA